MPFLPPNQQRHSIKRVCVCVIVSFVVAVVNSIIASMQRSCFVQQTRVLVTHAIHWLPSVDSVVVMRSGQISEVGSYQDLLSHDKAFAQFLRTYLTHDDQDDDDETDAEGEPLLGCCLNF